MKGIVIAGTHSGCGKTTVTLGLLAAIKEKGLRVQSFKTGPDFIDSGLHRLITGRPSRNLDLWMCGEDYVRRCFLKNSKDVALSVVEGVMGLYDGNLSTAALAATLHLPVILVVDAYGMAESAGAIVKGFTDFRLNENQSSIISPKSPIVGVIFNRVASENHYERLKRSVRDVEVFGYLPRDANFVIPHRHLGLVVAEEGPISDENLRGLADTVLTYVDVDSIIERQSVQASECQSIEDSDSLRLCRSAAKNVSRSSGSRPSSVKIAVAYDKAFCFYYEDNFDLLREAGAEIMTFSPLSDPGIPEGADAVYIGGGYPEIHAEELSRNHSMRRSVLNWARSGRPLYAECGGLMYLSQGIYDFDGNYFEMSGVFPFETQMKKGRSRLGYREVTIREDCILGMSGDRIKGHEFHYSEIRNDAREGIETLYSVTDASGKSITEEGYRFRKTLASYIHAHFGSNPSIAEEFIQFCKGE